MQLFSTFGKRYSRMDQVKLLEESLLKNWRDMVCLSRPYPFKYFKSCHPQILFKPFLNTLSHLKSRRLKFPMEIFLISNFSVSELHGKYLKRYEVTKAIGWKQDGQGGELCWNIKNTLLIFEYIKDIWTKLAEGEITMCYCHVTYAF